MYINFEFDLFGKRKNYNPYNYMKDDALTKAMEYLEKTKTLDSPFASLEEVIKTARTFETFLDEGKKHNG